MASGDHEGQEPRVGVELVSDRQYGTHLGGGVLCLMVIRFVDAEDVRYLHDPGLERLHRVPRTRLQAKHHRVRSRGDLDLSLTNPDRLVEDHVVAARFHRDGGESRASGEPTQVSAATHRADEHSGGEEVVREPYAVAEDGTLRKRARRVDRYHPDPPVFLPVELY